MKLYNDLASWWPLMSSPKDYAEEANEYHDMLTKFSPKPVGTVLELGSGGGNNALYLKKWYKMTLTDLSDGMLAVSRKLNPECEHILGDMRNLRLGKTFDAVFVHDAVMYMATENDLRQAIVTAFEHTKPGGIALFVPDWIKEQFQSETEHGGEDGPDRALRYLMWTHDPNPTDTVFNTDFVYMLRQPDGSLTIEEDHHIDGLFTKDQWLGYLKDAGFQAQAVPLEYSFDDSVRTGFVGTRPV